MLLPDLYGEFFSEVIRGADQAARARGFHLLVSSSHASRSEVETALRAMRGRVDGLVVMSPDVDARGLAANLPDRLPVVLVNAARDAEDAGHADGGHAVEWIGVDNYGGARAVTHHLLALGHRRVAIVTGGDRNQDARERLRGFRHALAEAGVPHEAALELAGDFSDEGGYLAAQRALAVAPRPSALFAANDAMAIGALGALREAGVRVPEEMAVAGFDDIPVARYVSPPLTTVHVDNAALGARAVERLVSAVTGKRGALAGARETLPATLVVRASCGARPAPAPAAMPPP
jgi:LacI family transcriptional regulator